jgi:ribosomal protein S18 acetylase RimI-like enzyme
MTAAGIVIREARLADARSVARVHVESWQHAYRGLVPDTYLARLSIDRREALWHKSIVEGAPELWVAESHADIVGWVAFGQSRDEDATPDTGEIEAIYIDPLHWQCGIGKALWSQARQRLIARNYATATLWVLADNERAIRFYVSRGFKQGSAPGRVSERDGKRLLEVRYEANLV